MCNTCNTCNTCNSCGCGRNNGGINPVSSNGSCGCNSCNSCGDALLATLTNLFAPVNSRSCNSCNSCGGCNCGCNGGGTDCYYAQQYGLNGCSCGY